MYFNLGTYQVFTRGFHYFFLGQDQYPLEAVPTTSTVTMRTAGWSLTTL